MNELRNRWRLPRWPVRARRTPPAPVDWRTTVRRRLFVGAVLFGLWTIAIEARLMDLQVVQYADLTARADRQQMRTITPPAKRGEILDRHGRVLAVSVDAESVAAIPTEIDDPDQVAARICASLDDCTADRRQAMVKALGRKSQFAWLARQISPQAARKIRDLDLPGITLLDESRRYYPNKNLAAQVLGYVGLDNVGLAGIESTYNRQIRGQDGKVLIQTDARRHAIGALVERPATAGEDIELTIDEYLQYVAERELRAGVEENHAAGGSVVIMDPFTGEILAMANWPTFNPNVFARADEDARRNRAVQDLYEPGSTFKIVTASAALQDHVMTPDTLIDTSPGYITFGNRVIHDDQSDRGLGTVSFTDVLVRSSNVGAIKIGMKVGAQRLGAYVARFGFGQTIAPDFRGESAGIVWNPARLDASALASMSMGYQVGVTAIQMASAASVVANGGALIEPRVVRAFIENGRRVEVPRTVVRRAIAPETAATLTTILEQVVERGTAKAARIDGYTIAGKTGTAQKLVNGHYSRTDYTASFVGFVPSRHPAATILVVVDSPHGHGYYGGSVSAPIFKRIAEAALTYFGIAPTIGAAPPVLVAERDASASAAQPEPVGAPSVLKAVLEPARSGLMPDLHGLSARDALRVLSRIGLSGRMSGDGFVVDQSPQPGSPLMAGGDCLLRLDRRPPAAPAGAPQ